jgi:hypothetical protein
MRASCCGLPNVARSGLIRQAQSVSRRNRHYGLVRLHRLITKQIGGRRRSKRSSRPFRLQKEPAFSCKVIRGGGAGMRSAALAILVFTTVASARAENAAPVPQRKMPMRPLGPSLYCLSASAAFLESEEKASDQVKKCSAGDTIVVPAKSAGAVARTCDFSKSIVAIGENVVCIMVPERASR